MQYIRNLLLLLVVSIFTVACTTSPVVTGSGGPARGPAEPEAPPPVVEEQPEPPAPQPVELEIPDENIVYFDYDRSEIKPEAFEVLDEVAAYLLETIASNNNFVIEVEGHTDERGTEQYNLALGNRRAESVARYLRVKGVPADNIRTQSFGESEPAVLGAIEAAYSRNRRAVIVF